MAEEIDGNTGGAEEFVPAFTPAEAGNPVVDINEAKTITLPPELDPNPIGYKPTDAEIEAEVGQHIEDDPVAVSPAEARIQAERRLIRRANNPDEAAVSEAQRADFVKGIAAGLGEKIDDPQAPLAPVTSISEAPGFTEQAAPTELREAVDRVVPDMPEGPSTALTAAMAGENVEVEGLPQSELDKFVADNELAEDEPSLVAFANLAMDRTKNQQSPKGWDRNLDAKIREQQKVAFNALSPKAKEFAGAYVSRYERDIKQKEAEAEAA
jgi:hypothetical protein